MKPRPDYQRKQAHRRRLALGRALHQLRGMRRDWFIAWDQYLRRRGPSPAPFSLPKIIRHRKKWLYAQLMGDVVR